MNFFKKNNQPQPSVGGCPGSAMRQFENASESLPDSPKQNIPSELRQWPVQLKLVPSNAPYFKNVNLQIVADCVPFAYGNYHQDFLKDKPVVVGCPKLDDLNFYTEKLTQVFKENELKSVEVLLMEVPCCSGIVQAAKVAREQSGAQFPIKITTIGVRGENFGTQEI